MAWRYKRLGTAVVRVEDDNGLPVVDFIAPPGSAVEDHARLIAASPELLAALEGLLELGKRDLSNPKYDGYFQVAREAINKAKGV